MLHLQNIVKDYVAGDTTVRALKGIDLTFRKSEFVAILGASGCGKTTLLNIVGGLDRYTDGDLIIRGKSTKQFKAYDWDAYRNSCIGFVFQNYNLIPHQTVVGNVELALTLSGISKAERHRRAVEALKKVGLEEQINKRPNQLSGGQMQRVAIARAIVNDPEIILADEPTGALDSKTSVQISDLLKEISKDRLIIMVTHNNELAEQYATRIVRLSDGEVVDDSDPYTPEEEAADEHYVAEDETAATERKRTEVGPAVSNEDAKEVKKQEKQAAKAKKADMRRTSMKFTTALGLSFRNLITKKGRTFMTSFAGSIGIIGIALVLAISNGFNNYIDKMQKDMLSNYPVTVSNIAINMESMMEGMTADVDKEYAKFPSDSTLNVYDNSDAMTKMMHINFIDDEYVRYVDELKEKTFGRGDTPVVLDIQKSYSAPMNILYKTNTGAAMAQTVEQGMMGESSLFQELLGNADYIATQYDVIYGEYPKTANDIALVVDSRNRISLTTARALGVASGESKIAFDKLIGKEYRLLLNDGYYRYDEAADSFSAIDETDYAAAYESEQTIPLRITAVMRIREDAPLSLYNTGLVYLPALTEQYLTDCASSQIGVKQKADGDNVYRALIPDAYINDVDTTRVAKGILADEEARKQVELALGVDLSQLPEAEQIALVENMMMRMFSAPKLPMSVASLVYSYNYKMQLSADQTHELACRQVGASDTPSALHIYPQNFESKKVITDHLDAYNKDKPTEQQVLYTDAASMLSSTMGQLVDIISYVLIAFAAVSLVVSSIMIGIITYVSVIERTKEIGVLRAIGARKKDITRVFNAETLLIGFTAGLIGVAIAFILTFPVSAIIKALADGMVTTNMAVLSPIAALILVAISCVLTLVSGLIPARWAAKKDPVVALRTE